MRKLNKLCSLFLTLALFLSYFYLDKVIASQIPIYPSFSFMSALISPCLHLILFSTLALYYLWRRDTSHGWLFEILLSIITMMFLTGVMKIFLGRARPILLLEEGIYGWFPGHFENAYRSFPSSHASLGMIFFYFSKVYLKKYHWIITPTIFVCIISRILLKDHFLTDLIVGSWIGYRVANLIHKISIPPINLGDLYKKYST